MQHENDFSELDELTEELLGFAALSEGLGFQNAKPIAMKDTAAAVREELLVTKAKQGIGAVAAGPAMPASAYVGLTHFPKQNVEVRKAIAPQAAVNITTALQEAAAAPVLRISAFLLDLLFVSAPLALTLKLNFSAKELHSLWHLQSKSFIAFYLLFVTTYFLLSESFGGQSLGKMLFQLRIVEDDKYQKPIGLKLAFARMLSLILGAAFVGLGLLSALWDSKSRPFHDKVTGSIVRKKK